MPRGQGGGPPTPNKVPPIIYEDELQPGIIYEDELPKPPSRAQGAGPGGQTPFPSKPLSPEAEFALQLNKSPNLDYLAPITQAPKFVTDAAKTAADFIDDPNADTTQKWFSTPRAFAAGSLQGAAELASPLNVGLAVSGQGELIALRRAQRLMQLGKMAEAGSAARTAQNFERVNRLAAIGGVAHSADTLTDPNSTGMERIQAVPEMAGSLLGLRSRVRPTLESSPIPNLAGQAPAGKPDINLGPDTAGGFSATRPPPDGPTGGGGAPKLLEPVRPTSITVKPGPQQLDTIAILVRQGYVAIGTDANGGIKLVPPPVSPSAEGIDLEKAKSLNIPVERLGAADTAISGNRIDELTQQFAQGNTARTVPEASVGDAQYNELLGRLGGKQEAPVTDILGGQPINPNVTEQQNIELLPPEAKGAFREAYDKYIAQGMSPAMAETFALQDEKTGSQAASEMLTNPTRPSRVIEGSAMGRKTEDLLAEGRKLLGMSEEDILDTVNSKRTRNARDRKKLPDEPSDDDIAFSRGPEDNTPTLKDPYIAFGRERLQRAKTPEEIIEFLDEITDRFIELHQAGRTLDGGNTNQRELDQLIIMRDLAERRHSELSGVGSGNPPPQEPRGNYSEAVATVQRQIDEISAAYRNGLINIDEHNTALRQYIQQYNAQVPEGLQMRSPEQDRFDAATKQFDDIESGGDVLMSRQPKSDKEILDEVFNSKRKILPNDLAESDDQIKAMVKSLQEQGRTDEAHSLSYQHRALKDIEPIEIHDYIVENFPDYSQEAARLLNETDNNKIAFNFKDYDAMLAVAAGQNNSFTDISRLLNLRDLAWSVLDRASYRMGDTGNKPMMSRAPDEPNITKLPPGSAKGAEDSWPQRVSSNYDAQGSRIRRPAQMQLEGQRQVGDIGTDLYSSPYDKPELARQPDDNYTEIMEALGHDMEPTEHLYGETMEIRSMDLERAKSVMEQLRAQLYDPTQRDVNRLEDLQYLWDEARDRVNFLNNKANNTTKPEFSRPVDESGQPIETKEWTPEELAARKKQIATDWYRARTQARALGIDDKKYRHLDDLRKAIADITDKPQLIEEETGMDLGKREDVLEIFRNTYTAGADVSAPKELLQNALDATKGMGAKGEIEIEVSRKNHTFTMKDNGPGLTPKEFKEVYLDLTASGKRGKGLGTIGEMGVGKVSYLIGGKAVEVTTIAKDPTDGKAYITTLAGTADEVLKKTAKLTIREARSPDAETGTTVKVTFEDDNNMEKTKKFFDEFLKYSSWEPNISISADGYWTTTPVTTNYQPKPYKPLKYLGDGEIVGSTKFKISIPDSADVHENSYVELVLNARGMFQGVQTVWLNKKAEVPTYLVIELDPTVSAKDKRYPLTAPTRQELERGVYSEIKKWVEENIVKKGEQEYIEKMKRIYATMTQNTSSDGKYVFMDGGERMTPTEMDVYKKSKLLQTIGKHIDDLIKELEMVAPTGKLLGPTLHKGFMMEEKVGGVNIKNPGSLDFTILINFAELALASDRSSIVDPARYARRFVHIVMHEFAHLAQRNEGAGFTWFLSEMYGAYPLEAQQEIANRIRDGITDLKGNYSPEFQELLRIYFESRGRRSTTTDDLFREKDIGSFAESQGPFFIRTGNKASGGNPLKRVSLKYEGQPKSEHKKLVKAALDMGMVATGFRDKNGNPIYTRPENEQTKVLAEMWNLPRGAMSVDLPFLSSAAFRQGATAILVDPAGWGKAWSNAARAYGNKAAAEIIKDEMSKNPYFQRSVVKDKKGRDKELPSLVEVSGLALTDTHSLSNREEVIKSTWAEKFPAGYGHHVAASNRAYTAFLNTVRSSMFVKFIDQARIDAALMNDPTMDPTKNLVLAKEIAEMVNVLTGRGPLSMELVPDTRARDVTIPARVPLVGGSKPLAQRKLSVEGQKSMEVLANIFFSPRLQASRLKMMNINTYISASPMVRQMYLRGALSLLAVWGGLAGLAGILGIGEIELNPNSSDFGKIRIGNTRIDPGAGFQQFFVLLYRHFSGNFKSSTSGEEQRPMRVGFRPITPGEVAQNFFSSKFHPSSKFIYDIEYADTDKPFYVLDRSLQLIAPMMSSDLNEILGNDPLSFPAIAGATGSIVGGSIGFGSQTYEGGINKPSLTPLIEGASKGVIPAESMDIRIPSIQAEEDANF